MTPFNTTLLLATIAGSALVTAAQAQPIPAPGPNDGDAALHGAGSSSLQTMLVQELNCIGGNNQLGTTRGLETVPEAEGLPTPSGPFNCATQELQPEFSARYVATGSGFGRQMWSAFSNQFAPTGLMNPFATWPQPWNRVQFAFADSTITEGDLDAYFAGQADDVAGAPIMFPKYVLPVAIAYNPVYGINTNTGQALRFNVQNPQSINDVVVGGLRMSRELYCKVFNGEVKNFNDPLFTAANGGVALRDPNDYSTRWNNAGVPVRLVGRLDRSGTTDIFTRALAAQCNNIPGLVNKYERNAETLPYDRSDPNAPDFSGVRRDTGLSKSSTEPVAGTTTLVSNQFFTGNGYAQVSGGATAMPTGNQGSGLFLLAGGSSGVRDAINFPPDYSVPARPEIKLNGKIGYIGAAFLANAPSGSPTLFAAALQAGNTSNYYVPSAAAAELAFGSILPPESAANGAYLKGDARQVRWHNIPNGGPATRQNPFAWYDVLYAPGSSNLANPADGYSITGTTQFMGYTCYTDTNRQTIANFLGWSTNAVTQDSAGNNRTGIFTSTAAAQPGLFSRSNIGGLPDNWKRAVTQTFLTNSNETSNGQRLGALNLWIQSNPINGSANTAACSGKTGA